MDKSNEDDYSRPFRVVILEDSRRPEEYGSHGNLSNTPGICLGQYLMPENLAQIPDLTQRLSNAAASGLLQKLHATDDPEEDVDAPSPLIVSDMGDYIWGVQCWWEKTEDLKDIPEALWASLPDAARSMLRTHFHLN